MKTQLKMLTYLFLSITQFKVNASDQLIDQYDIDKLREEALSPVNPSYKSTIKYFKVAKQYNTPVSMDDLFILPAILRNLNFSDSHVYEYVEAKICFFYSQRIRNYHENNNMNNDYLVYQNIFNKFFYHVGNNCFDLAVYRILELAENEELKTKVHRFAKKYLNSDERIRQKFFADIQNEKMS